MTDLFDSTDELTPIPLPESEVSCTPQLRLLQSNRFYFEHMRDTVSWRQEDITLWGKTYAQPRCIAWYGDSDCGCRNSVLDLVAHP